MAPVGRPPKAAAKPPEGGVVISKASNAEIAAARGWKKEEPKISYDVLKIIRDGKKIIKVRKVESRKGFTDQSLVFQAVDGKPVRQLMTAEQLTKLGVDLRF